MYGSNSPMTTNHLVNYTCNNTIINLQVHYIPINTQPYYKKKYGFKKNSFKNSLEFYNKEISMPIYYDLTHKQLNYIKKVSRKIFNF